jgi:hypothetical protein
MSPDVDNTICPLHFGPKDGGPGKREKEEGGTKRGGGYFSSFIVT